MNHNFWVIGSRTLTGDIGKVKAAGEVTAYDATINKMHIAGGLNIENSSVQKLRAAGEVNARNAKFGDCKVAGELNVKGFGKADTLVVVGDLNAELFECRILRNAPKKKNVNINSESSVVEFKGFIKAEIFESLYKFRLNCTYDFKNIISTAEFFYDGILECENFYSFGVINIKGVNAENIYIYPASSSKLESITGTNIVVSRSKQLDRNFKSLPKSMPNSFYARLDPLPVSLMALSSVEGDKISLDHVKADRVSGLNVKIEDLCIIDKAEYRDKIEISEKAIVNEVIKL